MISPATSTNNSLNLEVARKPTLDVIIPCYNEEKTIQAIVNKILSLKEQINLKRVIIVNDCSRDASKEIIEKIAENEPMVKYLEHGVNSGKGAALHTGIKAVESELCVIQDADNEYNPDDIVRLYDHLIETNADAAFGSRFMKNAKGYATHIIANKFLTLLTGIFIRHKITDMETCYKMVKSEYLKRIDFIEKRFGFEPEVTIKLSLMQPKPRIVELPIDYNPRSYDEGKKIGMKDGIRAIYCILKYGLFRA